METIGKPKPKPKLGAAGTAPKPMAKPSNEPSSHYEAGLVIQLSESMDLCRGLNNYEDLFWVPCHNHSRIYPNGQPLKPVFVVRSC